MADRGAGPVRAIEESGESGERPRSRAAFAGACLAGAGGLLGATLIGRGTESAHAGSPAEDMRILNLALRLEYTEAAFYTEALRRGALSGELETYARTVLGHEQAHVAFLRKALGTNAAARPSFDFGRATRDPKAFASTAIKLEELSVAGYNGQAVNLTPKTLAAAAEIVSVEARHAAWIRTIAGLVAAPKPIDAPVSAVELERGLRQIGVR